MYKSSGLVSDYNILSNLRAVCNCFIIIDYRNYLNKIQINLTIHPNSNFENS